MMKTGTLLTKWFAVLCAALLMISLFAVPVFAAETESAPATEAAASGASGGNSAADEDPTTDPGTTETTDPDTAEDPSGLSTKAIIWIIVGAVILVVVVVLVIKFRAKIAHGLRVYKSEFKKVSWLSWEQTRKSTFVVVVVLLAFAAVICLLDMGLFRGLDKALDTFKGWEAFQNLFVKTTGAA